MKNLLYKWLTAVAIFISLGSFPGLSQASYCEWRDGHRVCWHHHRHYHCYWVGGYWHHGHYHPAQKVCKW